MELRFLRYLISEIQFSDDIICLILQDDNGSCSDIDEEFYTVVPEIKPEFPDNDPLLSTESELQLNKQHKSICSITTSRRNDDEESPSSSKKPKLRLWKTIPYQDKPHEYPGHPSPNKVRSPFEYFSDYFDDDFYEVLAFCTNLSSLRKTGRNLNTTKQEIKKLIGIHLLMGILSYPKIAMYWRQNIRVEMISSAMARDRFRMLRENLHIVDSESPSATDAGNPLWQVQPVIDAVKKGCHKILRTPGRYSLNKQIIPITGKDKFRPVGLQNFVATTSEGLMVDFEIYYPNNPALSHPLGLGPAVVLRLIESIPRESCIFFDRNFTTIPLLDELTKLGYHGTGTIMANRVPNWKQVNFKDDTDMCMGEIEQRVSNDVALVKWKDNKTVLIASNCTGSKNIDVIQRYDSKEKKSIDVNAPKIVTSYNEFVGAVDLLNHSIEYYRTHLKTHKWHLKVILHFIDLAMVNSWLLYRNDSLVKGVTTANIKDLLAFRFEIADTLISSPDRERRDLSPEVNVREESSTKYKPANAPSLVKRYDGYDHFPKCDNLKAPRCCRLENCSSRSRVRCRKCNVYLCNTRENDCFYIYHKKE